MYLASDEIDTYISKIAAKGIFNLNHILLLVRVSTITVVTC